MKTKIIFVVIATLLGLYVFTRLSTSSQKTIDVEKNGLDEERSIKSFVESQYKNAYSNFELVRWQSYKKTFDGHSGIIKFTYDKDGIKMFGVNNVRIDEDGYVKEVTYSSSIPYKDLKIDP